MPALPSFFDPASGSVHADLSSDAIRATTAPPTVYSGTSTPMPVRVGMTLLVVVVFMAVIALIATAVRRGPRIVRFASALCRLRAEGDGKEVADSDSDNITTKRKNMKKKSKTQQETILPVTVAPSVAAAAAAALITLPPPAPVYVSPRPTNATSLVRCNAISLRLNPPPLRAPKVPIPPPPPSASPTIFHEVVMPEAIVPTSAGAPIKLRIQVHGLPVRSLGEEGSECTRVKKGEAKSEEEVQKDTPKLVMMGTFDSDTSVSTAASAVTITYDSPTPMNGPTFQSSPAQIRVRTLKASDAKVEEAQPIARTIIMNAFTDMDPDASMSTIASGISDESFMPMDGPVLVPVPAPVHVPSDVREQEAQLVMPTTTADMGMDPDTTVSSSASAITIVYSSPTPMNGAVFEPPATPSPAPHLGDASDALQSPEGWRSSPLPRPENRLAHYDTSGGSLVSEEFPMDGFDLTMSPSGFSMASYTNNQFSAGMGRTSSPRNKYRAPRSTGGVLDAIDTNLHSKDEKSIKKKKTNPTGRLREDTCKGGKENRLAVRLGGN